MASDNRPSYLFEPLPDNTVKVPEGAEDLFPHHIGPHIYAIRGKNQILKAGFSVQMSEAAAMRFVAEKTSIPVPVVYESYVENGDGYILMSKIQGVPLKSVWKELTPERRAKIVSQVKGFLSELQSPRGEYYGALWQQPSEDIFFKHFPFKEEEYTYGPYRSRQEYNDGLLEALKRSGPTMSLDGIDQDLLTSLASMDDDTKIFSHGDLHMSNILVDTSTDRVTGIVDWEAAGFTIRGREYYETKLRARDVAWIEALDEIFPEVEQAPFELLQRLDRALKRHTFI